jgi:hypothetical protein
LHWVSLKKKTVFDHFLQSSNSWVSDIVIFNAFLMLMQLQLIFLLSGSFEPKERAPLSQGLGGGGVVEYWLFLFPSHWFGYGFEAVMISDVNNQ